MSDTVALLREREGKLLTRVTRARASLETAEAELDEVRTALKVLIKMGLAPEIGSVGNGASVEAMNDSQATVLACVPFGEHLAIAPKDVIAMLQAGGDFGQSGDYVRTVLWRLAKRGLIQNSGGYYWRPGDPAEAEKVEAPDAEATRASKVSGPLGGERGYPPSAPEGSNPSGSTQSRLPSYDDDLDPDVPF